MSDAEGEIPPPPAEVEIPPPPPPTEQTASEFKTFYLPIYVISAVFGIIFFIGPLTVRKCTNKGIIRCSIMLSAFSMWIFWVTVYIAQMNPLVGPRVNNMAVAWMAYKWGEEAGAGGQDKPSEIPELPLPEPEPDPEP